MPNAEQWVDLLRQEYVEDLDAAVRATESPIEAVMLWALIVSSAGWNSDGRASACELPLYLGLGYPGRPPGDDGIHLICVGDDNEIAVAAPVEANGARYRIDLAVIYDVRHLLEGKETRRRAFVAVECDGHDFHEKTKEQAERDKKRDRDLQSIGWRIARFTGSEIIRDPHSAAIQVWQLASRTLALQEIETAEGH